MKQISAVEWLVNEITVIDWTDPYWKLKLEQAKAMEKEQIIDACNLQRNDYKGMPTYNKSGEQYYNETYGGNK
jgi:hypothetical protein